MFVDMGQTGPAAVPDPTDTTGEAQQPGPKNTQTRAHSSLIPLYYLQMLAGN